MKLIDDILSVENMERSKKAVKKNKGAPGIDGMTVKELDEFFEKNGEMLITQIRNREYRPKPVRRIYIPKPNSEEKRPLGIPCCVDRVIQAAIAQQLNRIYEPCFSEHSHGFRKNRSCHTAMEEALGYLNAGLEWVVDFDIAKFFDTVNHDKLISIIREKMNDADTLHLIRIFLKAGIMEDGLWHPTDDVSLPQGGALSPVLSNIYLDKLDKELESRGLHFCRYADDFRVFVRTERSAERVMKSVSSWIERKLFLKVSVTKTKVVRPTKGDFLGFGFLKYQNKWECKPLLSRKQRLIDKVRNVTCRRKAASIPLSVTIFKVNEIVRGWINYYRIGMMKGFLGEFSAWLRHRIRMIMLKQWKKPSKVIKSLEWYCRHFRIKPISEDAIYKIANSRRGWYARSNGDAINYILTPKVLSTKIISKSKGVVLPALIDPLAYYQNRKLDDVLYLL